MKPIFLQNQN